MIYILRCILLLVPNRYFIQINTLPRKCKWEDRPPRISSAKMRFSFNEGDFNLPDFQIYHWAFIL